MPMRSIATKSWSWVCASLLVLTVACGDDKGDESSSETGETVGDGDGDPTTTGDGDGDPTTGDGDGDGDGDPTTGDGDGDPTTGDGDGDPTTGDGDGDPTTGDGDGDPNLDCYGFDETECGDNPDCQAVTGSPLKTNGPNSPCLEPSEFLGCIPASGCGDAETWFCDGPNSKFLVPDTCGPEGAEQCDPPMGDVGECP